MRLQYQEKSELCSKRNFGNLTSATQKMDRHQFSSKLVEAKDIYYVYLWLPVNI